MIKFTLILFLFCFSLFSEENDKKNIEDFIDTYFKTWSSADMNGYKNCFHSEAIIHFERNGSITEDRLEDFILGQSLAHKQTNKNLKEIPLSKRIMQEGNKALVIVNWKLFSDKKETTGYDYFTLLKVKGKWKITYLIFHNDN
jgi:hypothetical protein